MRFSGLARAVGCLLLLAAGGLGDAMLAAQLRVGVVALLVRRLWNHRRHLHAAALLVHGHKHQKCAGHVQQLAGLRVFGPGLHAHLHRSGKGPIDAGAQNHQIAQMYRADKVDVVHRGGHHVGTRMAIGGHRARHVDKVQQPPAQQVAQNVGVVGQHKLRHLRLRVGHGAGDQAGSGGNVGEVHLHSAPSIGLRLQCTPNRIK